MNQIPLSVLFATLFLLILLSAFFSSSETALMTLNRYRLRHLVSTGHKGATLASQLLATPDRLIGLILLGNNFVNILASSLATLIALRIGGDGAIAIAAGLLTLVILVFAEVTPKTLAALHPERIAFPAAQVYGPLLKLLYPLVFAVNILTNGLLRLLGVSMNGSEHQALSQEELRTVVMEAGVMMPKRHRNMLLSILDLEKASVEDIMVPRNELDGIDLRDPLNEIVDQIYNTLYTRLLVFDGSIDNVIGVVHIRRLLQVLTQGALTKELINGLCVAPYYIPEGTSLNRQLLNFQRKKRRLGLVVDEYGDLLGLVTMADLLEEIVGEFATDPADQVLDIQPQEDGSFLVDGSTSIRELNRTLNWDLPTDGPKTLNGLILEYMETIPEPGTSLRLAGYPAEIIQTKDNAVKMVRFYPVPEQANSNRDS